MNRVRPQRVGGGFSVTELLVVLLVFSIITTTIALLFTRGASTYRHGETHIEMQRAGRNIVARVSPYVNSMFNAASPSTSAVLIPPAADPNVNHPSVRFRTTEDWLGAAYPSVDTTSTMANSTADLGTFTYQIVQEGNGNIVLQRLEEPVPDTFNITDSFVLRVQKEGNEIRDLRFTLVRANLLVMEFTTAKMTRGEANTPLEVEENFRITFNIPTKSV